MWTVTTGVLISALFCASHSKTEESKDCEKSTRVKMTLAQLIPDQKYAIQNALPETKLPSDSAVVYSFNKTVSNRKTSEGGMKAHIVIYIPMVEEMKEDIYGYFNFNGHAWGFHRIEEKKYNDYARWCGITEPKPRK